MAVNSSSDNNNHLQRNANNCLNSILCVTFADNNVSSRNLRDDDIHQVAHIDCKARLQRKKMIIVLDLKVSNVSVINYAARRTLLEIQSITKNLITVRKHQGQFFPILFQLCYTLTNNRTAIKDSSYFSSITQYTT